MKRDKPFRTISELIALLKSRELHIEDENLARRFLHQINYYRFSGYAREFQINPAHGNDQFAKGVSFEHIRQLMTLDSQLRHLLLQQLEVIETTIRAEYAHELGRLFGNTAFYLDEDTYVDVKGKPSQIVDGIIRDLERSNSRMIGHYTDTNIKDPMSRYQEVPIWVAVEVMSFGRISNMLVYMKEITSAKKVAENIGVQWGPFSETIHSFSVLRNICAHWMQLWNRTLDIQCHVPKKYRPRNIKFTPNSMYAAIIMLNHYRLKIDGNNDIGDTIEKMLNDNPEFGNGIRNPQMK